jgi:hypothetical protein
LSVCIGHTSLHDSMLKWICKLDESTHDDSDKSVHFVFALE